MTMTIWRLLDTEIDGLRATVIDLLDLGLDELCKQPPSTEKALALAITGLYCDGGHHKQWFLEKVIEALEGAPYKIGRASCRERV